jgi:hypothetical protein
MKPWIGRRTISSEANPRPLQTAGFTLENLPVSSWVKTQSLMVLNRFSKRFSAALIFLRIRLKRWNTLMDRTMASMDCPGLDEIEAGGEARTRPLAITGHQGEPGEVDGQKRQEKNPGGPIPPHHEKAAADDDGKGHEKTVSPMTPKFSSRDAGTWRGAVQGAFLRSLSREGAFRFRRRNHLANWT